MNGECGKIKFSYTFFEYRVRVWCFGSSPDCSSITVSSLKIALLPVWSEFPHHWSVNVTVLLSADLIAWILDDHDSSWPRNKFRKGIVLHLVQFCNAVYMLLCFSNAILIPFWEIFILPYPLFVRLMFYNLLVIFVFKDVNFLNRISFYLL
jgi:hypothetical protein